MGRMQVLLSLGLGYRGTLTELTTVATGLVKRFAIDMLDSLLGPSLAFS